MVRSGRREKSERKERRREMSLLYVGGTVIKGERKLSTKAAYSSLPSAHGAQSLSPTAVEVVTYYCHSLIHMDTQNLYTYFVIGDADRDNENVFNNT